MKVGGIGKKIANSKLMGKYNLEIGFIASTFFAAKAKNRKEIDYMTDSLSYARTVKLHRSNKMWAKKYLY